VPIRILRLSNQRITTLHFLLSEALASAIGRDAGPNFHSWAVWGSRKAGVTIRQEDLDNAVRDASITAGVIGTIVGIATGLFVQHVWLPSLPAPFAALLGTALGVSTGVWAGRHLAIWSRAKAANLVLHGNRIVMQDIGAQSARFLELIEKGVPSGESRSAFFAGLRPGPTEPPRHGQDRLATAFSSYLAAFESSDLEAKCDAMIAGNCEIVYHEHIRLEPYIRRAMPLIIRRCATQRLMTYEIGETVLAVGQDLQGVPTPTAAANWTKIEERMRYVFALFRKFHNSPEVFSKPYPEREMVRLAGQAL